MMKWDLWMMTSWQIMMNFCERGAIPWTSSWDLWELWEACSSRHSIERWLKTLFTPDFYGHVRVYTMYIPHSPTMHFLTKVDRNPFMPSFAIFWQANQNCSFNVVYENLPYGRTRPLGHRLGLAMRPFHDARRMRTMSAPFLSLT